VFFFFLLPLLLRVSSAAPAAPKVEAAPEVQKTIFNVVLSDVADMDKNKLKVIKAIRSVKPDDSLVQVLPIH
jgi:ribosomal protein L7/L12